MAEKKSKQEIEMPKDAVRPKKDGPKIFSMPKQYRGGKDEVLVAPKPEVKKPAVPPPPPPPPKPPIPKPAMVQPKKKGIKGLVIIGFLVLIVLGVGGYFLIQSVQEEEVETPPTTTTTPPPIVIPTQPDDTDVPDDTDTPDDSDTPSPFPQGTSPGIDIDRDGLTDLEERTIYQTDPALPDTDGDGFLDGNEVFHRYDPNGPAPGTLETAELVRTYLVTQEEGMLAGYSIAYPAIWSVRPDTEISGKVVFGATSGETITIELVEKPANQTLQEWFNTLDNDEVVTRTTTKNGYNMLASQNKLKAYVQDTRAIMVFTYDSGIKGTVDYLQTFQMMLNSMVWEEIELET